MIDWGNLSRRLGFARNVREPPRLPAYAWSYFDHLVAVYVNLGTDDSRADAVIKKSSDRPNDLTWGDIFLLENTNFSLMSPELVERSAWILRERLREISGTTVYDKYLDSNVPKETDTPTRLALLKADLSRVLDVLHWYYSLIPMRERIRRSLTADCIVMVLVYTVLLGSGLFWCHGHNFDFLAMVAAVLYFGIIGGFVSSQRRMQGLPNDGDPIISVFGLANAGYYLWLSPLLGAIFAIILTLMFVAGVLKGTIFPEFYLYKFAAGTSHGFAFFEFVSNTLPKDGEEYGKLFLWAFLAGFAERLVPDSLDRLASKLDPRTQPQPPRLPSLGGPANSGPQIPQPVADPKKKIADETLQDAMHTGETPKDSPGSK